MKSKYTYIYVFVTLLIIISFSLYSFGKNTITKNSINIKGTQLINGIINPDKLNMDVNELSNYKIEFEEKSSSAAIKDVLNKSTNLAFIDRQVTEEEQLKLEKQKIQKSLFAKTFLVVIVNNSNKVSKISLNNLKKISSNYRTNWNEIDSTIKTGNANFIMPSNKLEYLVDFWDKNVDYFAQNNTDFSNNINKKISESKNDTYKSIIDNVKSDKDAISIVPYSEIENKEEVKILPIGTNQLPTNSYDNVTYPYTLNLTVLFKKDNVKSEQKTSLEVFNVLKSQEFKQRILNSDKNNLLIIGK